MESQNRREPAAKPLDFWKEFVYEARVTVEELERRLTRTKDEGIGGSCTAEEPSQICADHQCTIVVSRISTRHGPESCQVCFYYKPGTEVIRVCAWEDREMFIQLHTSAKGILANLKDRFMTATQLASFVVVRISERVKFPE